MNTPASAARRIIFGTGLGLIVISGLLFTMNFLPPVSCSSEEIDCISTNFLGWLIPIFGILFFNIGVLMFFKPNLFGTFIPDTAYEERRNKFEKELLEEESEDSRSNETWASLEKKLLTSKIEEE